jgi:hypothetical protein
MYKTWNGPMPTTAAQATVATGTAIKTMLQIATPSTHQLRILEWGYTVNTNSAGGGIIELIETDVARRPSPRTSRPAYSRRFPALPPAA